MRFTLSDAADHINLHEVSQRLSSGKAQRSSFVPAALKLVIDRTPAKLDILVEELHPELKMLRERIGLIEASMKETRNKAIDDMIVTNAKASDASERAIKELTAIKKSMTTLTRRVETAMGKSSPASVTRLHG